MRLGRAAISALALVFTGCSSSDFSDSKAAPYTLTPAVTGYSLYHAYGDSITAGVGVSDPNMAYPGLAAAYDSVPLSNYAISGDEACDVATLQIFPHSDSPALATNGLYSLLIGTNDVDVRGTGVGEATFNLCHGAVLSWLATPQEDKLLATSPSVTVTGASHLDGLANYNAVTTDAQGASIIFPFTRATAAPVYLWYRITDGYTNTFTCTLDGSVVATLADAPTPAILTQNGNNTAMGVLRVAAVPAGSHSLRCVQTGTGPAGMGLIAMGGPPPAGTVKRPRLLAGLLPPQVGTGRSATIAAYDADIKANVALYAGDGLDIELFNAAAYMSGTTADFSDSLHPNALGYQEIFGALQLALNQPVPR